MAHQLSGVRWLFGAFGRGGGLLTDEPGLGKTLQVIVLLEALIRAGRVTRALIAAPANLCDRCGGWAIGAAAWRRPRVAARPARGQGCGEGG